MLVIDTRARHALADGQYGNRRRACEQGASMLGVRSLRDITGDRRAADRIAPLAARRIPGVLAPQADEAVEAAVAAGAAGARMTGGGFGGSMVALCLPNGPG